jgi:hypothetical protein
MSALREREFFAREQGRIDVVEQEARYWRVLDAWRRSCRQRRLDIEAIEREVRIAGKV